MVPSIFWSFASFPTHLLFHYLGSSRALNHKKPLKSLRPKKGASVVRGLTLPKGWYPRFPQRYMPVFLRHLWMQMRRRHGAYRSKPCAFLTHVSTNLVPERVHGCAGREKSLGFNCLVASAPSKNIVYKGGRGPMGTGAVAQGKAWVITFWERQRPPHQNRFPLFAERWISVDPPCFSPYNTVQYLYQNKKNLFFFSKV